MSDKDITIMKKATPHTHHQKATGYLIEILLPCLHI